MTVDIKHLDAHEQPSDELRAKWKVFAKTEPKDLRSEDIDDLQNPESAAEFCLAGTLPVDTLNRSFRQICPDDDSEFQATKDAPIYYHPLLPGESGIYPSRLPRNTKLTLLRPPHRPLSNPPLGPKNSPLPPHPPRPQQPDPPNQPPPTLRSPLPSTPLPHHHHHLLLLLHLPPHQPTHLHPQRPHHPQTPDHQTSPRPPPALGDPRRAIRLDEPSLPRRGRLALVFAAGLPARRGRLPRDAVPRHASPGRHRELVYPGGYDDDAS